MTDIKVVLIGPSFLNKKQYLDYISDNTDLKICKNYTSNENTESKYLQFLSKTDIEIGNSNNAFLFCTQEKDYHITCIDESNVALSDVLYMNIVDFNNISEIILTKYNLLVIWLDTKFHSNDINNEIVETKYLLERLDYTDYMYFLDESPKYVTETILNYINGNDDYRKILLEENC